MKLFLIPLLTLCYFFASAQKKNCTFEKFTSNKGLQIQSAITKTVIGKFFLGKEDGQVFFAYIPKALQAIVTNNTNNITLKLDSAIFIFDDQTKISIPVQGVGSTSNKIQLKPQLSNLYLGAKLTKDQVDLFKSKLTVAMVVKGEKESEGGDFLNEKDRIIFRNSFTCIE